MCSLLFCLMNLYVTGEIKANPGYDMWRNEGYWCMDHRCEGPLAEIRIGMAVQLPKGWELDYGFLHQSFPMENGDKGMNVPFVSLTWRPFR